MPRAATLPTAWHSTDHAWAQAQHRAAAPLTGSMHLPPDDTKTAGRLKDIKREQYASPTTGRNTKLGKKVEKPRDPKSGGPSGQKDRARHDKRHANK